MPQRWPTVKEIAKQTGYSEEHLRRLIREKKVAAELVGRIYFVDPDSFAAYAERAKQHPSGGPRNDRD